MIKLIITAISIVLLNFDGQAYHHNYYKNSTYDKRKRNQTEILNKQLNILTLLQNAIAHNHEICRNRQECERMDNQSFDNVQRKYEYDEGMRDFFFSFAQEIEQVNAADIVVTEFDVYNSLSEQGKQQYLNGVQINRPKNLDSKRKKGSNRSTGSNYILKFNLDDLKIYLLQEITKNHVECSDRNECLKSDLSLVNEVAANTEENNSDFKLIYKGMKERAAKQIFDAGKFCQMYRGKLEHYHAMLYKSDERLKWDKIVKNIQLSSRRDPKIINKAEVHEKMKPETQMREELEEQSKKVINNLMDNFFSSPLEKTNNKAQGTKPKDLLGQLFGG